MVIQVLIFGALRNTMSTENIELYNTVPRKKISLMLNALEKYLTRNHYQIEDEFMAIIMICLILCTDPLRGSRKYSVGLG